MDVHDTSEVEATAVDAPRFGDRRLGQLLCGRGFLDESTLDAALAVQAERGGRLGEILVGQRSITEAQLMEALALQLELTFVATIDDKAVSDELIISLPDRKSVV